MLLSESSGDPAGCERCLKNCARCVQRLHCTSSGGGSDGPGGKDEEISSEYIYIYYAVLLLPNGADFRGAVMGSGIIVTSLEYLPIVGLLRSVWVVGECLAKKFVL